MNVEETRLRQIIREEIRAALAGRKSCTPSYSDPYVSAGFGPMGCINGSPELATQLVAPDHVQVTPVYAAVSDMMGDRIPDPGEPRAPCARAYNSGCARCRENGARPPDALGFVDPPASGARCRYDAQAHSHGSSLAPCGRAYDSGCGRCCQSRPGTHWGGAEGQCRHAAHSHSPRTNQGATHR